ncbi:MAG: 50S ribosomal protein L4 [Erysipelotrichaceae bacterium]|nr:50S ribosomal protein L4 [Erysipelotrichaceae bacterium]MDP3305465.1 50S ribosomal protein L4 [Erysipelotrichaceae bacterium]
MLKLNVLNLEGKPVGEIELAAEVFGIEVNKQAIFDAIIMQRASLRQGTHDVKNRREVRGGGRKPWRQKGTGRARQGSIRSPQWRGGGIVFGPTPRSYAYKLNRKVRRLALKSVLTQKVLDSALLVINTLEFAAPKTKDFIKVMDALKLENKTMFVVSADEEFDNAFLSLRNLPNVMLLSVDGLNVYDISNADVLVFTEAAANYAGEVLV